MFITHALSLFSLEGWNVPLSLSSVKGEHEFGQLGVLVPEASASQGYIHAGRGPDSFMGAIVQTLG